MGRNVHRGGRDPVSGLWAALVVGLALNYACVTSQESSALAGGPGIGGTAALRLGPVDVLVFAPHPDDEVIGAGGVLQRALETGKHVRIVFATNGDGYPQAASALVHRAIPSLRNIDYLNLAAARQHEAMAADYVLGVGASDLVFLGYPDGVLAGVYADTQSEPVNSPTTDRTMTYGPVETDYHTLAHGQPAAYNHAAALADVEEILRKSKPTQLYVTDSADQHPDHKATYDLVRDAIAAIGFKGNFPHVRGSRRARVAVAPGRDTGFPV